MHMLHRPRRLRRTPVLRDAVAETHVSADHLMLPHFVLPDTDAHRHHTVIASMPGILRMTVPNLLRQVGADLELGINKIMLFEMPDDTRKSNTGCAAYDADGLMAHAVFSLKKEFGDALLIATDVCLCAFTTHGHCGVATEGHADHTTPHDERVGARQGEILNDASLPILAEMALVHAQAGADMVAPSDMMDGRIGALRQRLEQAGYTHTAILAHTAKYASSYYGPFREAAASAPGYGDRKAYQMDPRNCREAVREAALDEAEGADMIMIKPALAYLDVIAAVRAKTNLPMACYNVSAEYAMVKAAAQNGWINEGLVVRENLIAMRRAGADLLVTYHAREALASKWIG